MLHLSVSNDWKNSIVKHTEINIQLVIIHKLFFNGGTSYQIAV